MKGDPRLEELRQPYRGLFPTVFVSGFIVGVAIGVKTAIGLVRFAGFDTSIPLPQQPSVLPWVVAGIILVLLSGAIVTVGANLILALVLFFLRKISGHEASRLIWRLELPSSLKPDHLSRRDFEELCAQHEEQLAEIS